MITRAQAFMQRYYPGAKAARVPVESAMYGGAVFPRRWNTVVTVGDQRFVAETDGEAWREAYQWHKRKE